MKKFLSIIFLGLLLSGNANADDRFNSWIYNETKISEKCLKHLYPLASGDWYESYYDTYIEKLDEHWGNPKFELFVNTIGNYLGKEIPIGDIYKSSWDEEMTLTRYLDECNKGDEFQYKVMTKLPLYFCNDFAPYLERDCLSAVLIRHYSDTRVRVYGMTVYGLYDLEGRLAILPLRNLK